MGDRVVVFPDRYDDKLVVRFNGGPQAAHHVVLDDGTWHCFAQFGSGTLAGAHTFLAREMLVDPFLLIREAEVLVGRGIAAMDTITIDPRCQIVTPYHRMICRMKEAAADEKRSTTGIGVGECIEDPWKLTIGDLSAHDLRDRMAEHIETRKAQADSIEGEAPGRIREAYEGMFPLDVLESIYWSFSADHRARFVSEQEFLLDIDGPIIYEGAQGALLDRRTGNAPHITQTDCSPAAAHRLASSYRKDHLTSVIGVMRAYAHRHGNGPLPTEDPTMNLSENHNIEEEWQGPFRSGWLDLVATKKALEITGVIDGIALTHLDRIDSLDPFMIARRLESGHPVLEKIGPPDLIEIIEKYLDLPVTIRSPGPTAAEKTMAPATSG